MKKILVLILISSQSFAGNFVNVKVTDYGNTSDPSIKQQIDTLTKQLADQINSQLPSDDVDTFVNKSSDSAALANSGNGTNYYSPKDGVLIGLALGAAASLNGKSILNPSEVKNEDINGAGVSSSFLIGLSPSKFMTSSLVDLSKMRLSLFGMDKSVTSSDADLSVSGLGLGVSYKYIESKELISLVKWGGVSFDSGIRYFHTSLNLKQRVYETGPTSAINYGGTTVNVTPTFDGTVYAGVDSNILTIPLEASTSLELLKIFQLFGGVGVDVNSGSVSGKGHAQGPVEIATDNAVAGTVLAEASMNMDQSHNVDTFTSRYFVGGAIDLKYLSISAQLNKSLSSDSEGITIGIFSNF